MADNKKYYYLKLKDNFYDTEEMIILQNMQDGYLYSDILMKLYLRSLKNNGKLMFKDVIPYTPQVLAQVVRHQVGTVEKALKIFQDLGLIEVLDNGAIYMSDIQNFIGESSTEADRIRNYRLKIKQEVLGCTNVQQLYDKSTPEIEIDIEKEKEKEIDVDVVEEKKQQLQKLFINCTSSTNLNSIQECISYLDDLPYEVIEIALKKTSEKNGGWKYAKTILQNWLKAGIKTIEQVQAEELNFKSKKDNKNIIETNRIAYSEEDFTPEQWDRWMKDEMTEQELKSILEERKCMMKN